MIWEISLDFTQGYTFCDCHHWGCKPVCRILYNTFHCWCLALRVIRSIFQESCIKLFIKLAVYQFNYSQCSCASVNKGTTLLAFICYCYFSDYLGITSLQQPSTPVQWFLLPLLLFHTLTFSWFQGCYQAILGEESTGQLIKWFQALLLDSMPMNSSQMHAGKHSSSEFSCVCSFLYFVLKSTLKTVIADWAGLKWAINIGRHKNVVFAVHCQACDAVSLRQTHSV